MNNLLGVKICT